MNTTPLNKTKKRRGRSSSHQPPKQLQTFLDKVSFYEILLVWILTIILFGCFYFAFSNENNYLAITITQERIPDLLGHIYFSFITATTTGFGDIIPTGLFKIVSTLEVVFSLLVVAVVTSKLISLKQDIMISELYEITFNERINKIRSSLLFFRQTTNNLNHKIEEGSIKKRDINNLHLHLETLENSIKEINYTLDKSGKAFLRQISAVDTGIIANSITHSFERLEEHFALLEEHDKDWKSQRNKTELDNCIVCSEAFFAKIKRKKLLPDESEKAILEEKNKILEQLKARGKDF